MLAVLFLLWGENVECFQEAGLGLDNSENAMRMPSLVLCALLPAQF